MHFVGHSLLQALKIRFSLFSDRFRTVDYKSLLGIILKTQIALKITHRRGDNFFINLNDFHRNNVIHLFEFPRK